MSDAIVRLERALEELKAAVAGVNAEVRAGRVEARPYHDITEGSCPACGWWKRKEERVAVPSHNVGKPVLDNEAYALLVEALGVFEKKGWWFRRVDLVADELWFTFECGRAGADKVVQLKKMDLVCDERPVVEALISRIGPVLPDWSNPEP